MHFTFNSIILLFQTFSFHRPFTSMDNYCSKVNVYLTHQSIWKPWIIIISTNHDLTRKVYFNIVKCVYNHDNIWSKYRNIVSKIISTGKFSYRTSLAMSWKFAGKKWRCFVKKCISKYLFLPVWTCWIDKNSITNWSKYRQIPKV